MIASARRNAYKTNVGYDQKMAMRTNLILKMCFSLTIPYLYHYFFLPVCICEMYSVVIEVSKNKGA